MLTPTAARIPTGRNDPPRNASRAAGLPQSQQCSSARMHGCGVGRRGRRHWEWTQKLFGIEWQILTPCSWFECAKAKHPLEEQHGDPALHGHSCTAWVTLWCYGADSERCWPSLRSQKYTAGALPAGNLPHSCCPTFLPGWTEIRSN